MIITVEDLKKQANCGNLTDEQISFRLDAIESVIRAYTNNNFQQRGIRFAGRSEGMTLHGVTDGFAVGDTIQISNSVNDGLYRVTVVQPTYLQVAEILTSTDFNLVTKVKYPADILQCVVDLFNWKQNMSNKIGIKSETISRHSVTYEDSASLFMGYPMSILSGLSLYKKARC